MFDSCFAFFFLDVLCSFCVLTTFELPMDLFVSTFCLLFLACLWSHLFMDVPPAKPFAPPKKNLDTLWCSNDGHVIFEFMFPPHMFVHNYVLRRLGRTHQSLFYLFCVFWVLMHPSAPIRTHPHPPGWVPPCPLYANESWFRLPHLHTKMWPFGVYAQVYS